MATKVKEVFQRLETQTGQKLQKVRTDRGGEYLNTELDGYYKSKGVVHQTTAPYTPEQNGVAERFNRTLMERVRAMLLDAKLDKELWAEAAVTANYIKNRSPSSWLGAAASVPGIWGQHPLQHSQHPVPALASTA